MNPLVSIWILLSAWLVGTGWILSVFHALNRTGYAISLMALAALVVWWRRASAPARQVPGHGGRKFLRRCQRPAPLLFAVLFGLALADGILYAPGPGDASMYRTPRVLHWLAAEHWHWIRTFDIRMNIASCGFEWLTAPLMLFSHSDRFLFLINLFSFALLPGLVFSLFKQLKVSGRVSWWWMWLLPASLCYAFQAGTLANDGFAAVYALAAVVMALRLRESQRIADLAVSMLAVALLSGVKETNLPLVLLWLVAIFPAWRIFLRHPLAATGIVAASLLVSCLPTMWLNLNHDCNWAGVPVHPGRDWEPWKNIAATSPFWGVVGNLISLPLQTFAPPFFPPYRAWNEAVQHFIHTRWGMPFASFEHFCQLKSSLNEQTAGLGFALALLIIISLAWSWRCKNESSGPTRPVLDPRSLALLLIPWGLLLIFMAKVTSFESVRQLSPYYPFLLPLGLVQPSQPALMRRGWWRKLALLCMVISAILLVSSPTRPLWPARTVLNGLAQHHPNSGFLARARSFYLGPEIDRLSRNPFASVLPPSEPVIGYATDIRGLEPGLWRPFYRRVERVLPDDSRPDLDALGIRYLVVDPEFLTLKDCSIEKLMQQYDARLVDRLVIPKGWEAPPAYVYLIRLNSTPAN